MDAIQGVMSQLREVSRKEEVNSGVNKESKLNFVLVFCSSKESFLRSLSVFS